MKKIATIFAVYIFALVLMPCFEDEYHQDEASVNTERIFDGSHSELCSPFCSDHDCHTHITITFVNSSFVPEQFCEITTDEVTTNISTPFFAIWQPPKIG